MSCPLPYVIIKSLLFSLFCRSFTSLIYVNSAAFDHFKSIRDAYHRVTHHRGVVRVRDREVMRRVTRGLLDDADLLRDFASIPSPASFHPDDLSKVFDKYLHRCETMMGNEVANQLMEQLSMSKTGKLEPLRQVKRKAGAEVRLASKVEVKCDKVQLVKKKRRRKRKKKNW